MLVRLTLAAALGGLVGGLGASAQIGCGSDPPSTAGGAAGPGCTTDGECAPGERCVEARCQVEGDAGDGDATVDHADADRPDAVVGDGPSADAGPINECDECLEKLCEPEQSLCDAECFAIESCIQTFCRHLSEIEASGEEGKCQAKCQGDHPTGKQAHLSLALCVDSKSHEAGGCFPPCTPFPQDYDACRLFMFEGDCAAEKAACDANLACKNFGDCVGFCETAADCFKCDDTEEQFAASKLRLALEACVARECITEAWLP